MHDFSRLAAAVTIASLLAFPPHAADITVGLITSMTGPGASIGIPYSKGIAAGRSTRTKSTASRSRRFSSTTPPIRRPAPATPAS